MASIHVHYNAKDVYTLPIVDGVFSTVLPIELVGKITPDDFSQLIGDLNKELVKYEPSWQMFAAVGGVGTFAASCFCMSFPLALLSGCAAFMFGGLVQSIITGYQQRTHLERWVRDINMDGTFIGRYRFQFRYHPMVGMFIVFN
jgi:hypothetical protein